jgi:hypothetical protein
VIAHTEYTELRLNGGAARGQAADPAGAAHAHAHALDPLNFEAEFFGAAEVAMDPTATLEKQQLLNNHGRTPGILVRWLSCTVE